MNGQRTPSSFYRWDAQGPEGHSTPPGATCQGESRENQSPTGPDPWSPGPRPMPPAARQNLGLWERAGARRAGGVGPSTAGHLDAAGAALGSCSLDWMNLLNGDSLWLREAGPGASMHHPQQLQAAESHRAEASQAGGLGDTSLQTLGPSDCLGCCSPEVLTGATGEGGCPQTHHWGGTARR